MATRIQRIVEDDLDHSTDGIGTYRFALEGTEYEIDLAEHNLERLRAAVRPFIAAGRRLPKSPARRTGRAAPAAKADTGIRQWWREHQANLDLPGYNARGAIPNQVKAAFRDCTTQP
ncbi:histone-like nucleoid-structuring protein Lsr2 [Actinoplanes sp. CA-131856]